MLARVTAVLLLCDGCGEEVCYCIPSWYHGLSDEKSGVKGAVNAWLIWLWEDRVLALPVDTGNAVSNAIPI